MLESAPHAPVTYTAREARSVGEMFRLRARRSAALPALWEKQDGGWAKTTWRTFYDEARRVLAGLHGLGLVRGDKVAVLGETKKTWAVLDMGGQLGGFVMFGIYPKQPVDQIRYLLEHSDCRAVFVDSEIELQNVIAAAEQGGGLATLKAIVPWTESLYRKYAGRTRIVSPATFGLIPMGGDSQAEFCDPASEAAVDAALNAIDQNDTAVLVYTSGTTGPPKGAMISHANILRLLGAQNEFLELWQDDVSLSFLPMAHVAERILAFYGRLCTGLATAYATSTATVLDELKEVQPTVFGSVPRIFEKAHAKAMSELAKKPKAVQKLFAWALKVGTAKVALEHAGKPVPLALRTQHALADRLVWKRVRAAFGGRVRLFITGAAPIARQILEFFWAAGLPVYEAYGMTEATVATHMNRPGAVRLGSVGRVLAPMECRIAEDGEILLRGPWIFQGYYKQPEATRQTLVDGWLQTGDVGHIDADGFLFITDRKKHLIITAGGKNIAPANIEKALREESPLISQVHAHGDRRAFCSAIIAPSPLETLQFGVDHGLVDKAELQARTHEIMHNPTGRSAALEAAMQKVVGHPEFTRLIAAAVGRGNAKLAHVEQVRRFVLLDRDFSQERGELTPTLKLRRKDIELMHAPLLDRLYGEDGFGLEPG